MNGARIYAADRRCYVSDPFARPATVRATVRAAMPYVTGWLALVMIMAALALISWGITS